MAVIGAVVLVVFSYFFFKKPSTSSGIPVALTVWGTEPNEAIRPLLEQYHALHPNVSTIYTEVDPAAYDSKLINALASGQGPDILTVKSADVGIMKDKLAAAPTLTTSSLQTLFPKAVEVDAADNGAVYALPLSLDTLVLIYNRDLLDAAGIIAPPTTWNDVVADVARLTTVDDQNQIQRSTIALGGTTASIVDAPDILSLLMLQDGAPLSNQAHSLVTLGAQGEAALRFYTQFSNPASTVYSWNDELGDSYQRFADGKVAMLVAYPQALQEIKNRNAFIDVRIAPIPQAEGGTPKSFGTYPMLAVSKQSKNAATAWDLVLQTTTNKAAMAAYAERTGRAPALSAVIGDQIKQSDTSLLATQALQARSWFQWDGSGVRTAIDRAITEIISGVSEPARATQSLEQRLRALIRG